MLFLLFLPVKLLYLFINGVLVLASFFFRLPQGEFSDEKVNAVLVHGFLVRKEVLFLLRKKLERLGLNVILPELGWGTGDITDYANALSAFLQEKMKGKTILIGSSLGGIIALEAKRLNPSLLRIPVITLGAPVMGTPLARMLFWCQSGRQMQPGSNFLRRLLDFLKFNARDIVMVRASFDELVPKEKSCIKGAICKEVNVTGHGGLIFFIRKNYLKEILSASGG